MLFFIFVALLCGCSNQSSPWMDGIPKPKTISSPFWGSHFRILDPNNLGTCHNGKAKIGLIYTCKGGFIDTGHLYESIIRMRHIYYLVYHNLAIGNTEFSFQIIEPARYYMEVTYPEYWNELNPQEQELIMKEAAIGIAQYLTQTATVWHEIITYYDYSSKVIFSENVSSFSPEDLFSDFLGAEICAQAIRNGGDFDSEITRLLWQKLNELDAQPAYITREAIKSIKGKWYTGSYPFVTILMRYFDAGFDGYITACLVHGICPNAVPKSSSVSTLRSIGEKHNFSFKLELEPSCSAGRKALNSIGQKGGRKIEPEIYFIKMIQKIQFTSETTSKSSE